MVDALEKTDYVGTIGRWQFYGKNDQFTHASKYGKGYITGINLQWQDGKQVGDLAEGGGEREGQVPGLRQGAAAAN